MKTVNALTLRNNLGKVLEMLEKDGDPILVSKGRKLRAVLITPEDFQTRFVDKQAEDHRHQLLNTIKDLREDGTGDASSLDLLREMRGYIHDLDS